MQPSMYTVPTEQYKWQNSNNLPNSVSMQVHTFSVLNINVKKDKNVLTLVIIFLQQAAQKSNVLSLQNCSFPQTWKVQASTFLQSLQPYFMQETE